MSSLKCDILVLPLIFNIGSIDLDRLKHSLGFSFDHGEIYFPHYRPRFLENSDGWEPPYYPESQDLYAICVISWKIAESEWFTGFERVLKKNKFFQIYKIIMDKSNDALPPADYSIDEKRAFKLGAIYSYFKGYGAEGAACNRIVDLMNRLMQCDLAGHEFRDFGLRTQAQITWYVNREDYNIVINGEGQRVGAIEKYPIIDNFPKFAIRRLP